MGPIEGSVPASRTVPPGSSEAYRLPRSPWCARPFPRAPPRDRHLQRVVGGLGAHAARHRPADDHPRPYVHDGRRVEPAPMGPRVRDVGEPGPVRPVRAEIAAKQVRRGAGLRRGDKVNIKSDDRVTVPSSLARLHNRHWRHRTFAAFDHPFLLLSAGRSLSL